MKNWRKIFVVGVLASVALVTALTVFRPPLGGHPNFPTRSVQRITISQWKPNPVVITNGNDCLEIVRLLRTSRRSGEEHKCASIALFRIEMDSNALIEVRLAPGHWFENLEVVWKGEAYSLPRSAVDRIFELAESK